MFKNRLSQLNAQVVWVQCTDFTYSRRWLCFRVRSKAPVLCGPVQVDVVWTKRKHEHVTCVFLSSVVSPSAVNTQSCAKVLTQRQRRMLYRHIKNFSLYNRKKKLLHFNLAKSWHISKFVCNFSWGKVRVKFDLLFWLKHM